jgi:hypothetical protein
MGFVWASTQGANISLTNINSLIFVLESYCAICEETTDFVVIVCAYTYNVDLKMLIIGDYTYTYVLYK